MPVYHSSEWHRWDPHIHAPGTVLEDGFNGDWETYFEKIEKALPEVAALGVTDYLSIRPYEEFIDRRPENHAPGLVFIFPNIEFRLTPATTKGNAINAHVIVSPEDPGHVKKIKESLGRLIFRSSSESFPCTYEGLIELGRKMDPDFDEGPAYKAGVEQFKVDVNAFLDWYEKEPWLLKNSLLGVAGGNDGLAGLRRDSSFRVYHDTLVSHADFLFSSQDSDRKHYSGRNEGDSIEAIEERYGSLKPCLHGSDAHVADRILAPDLSRNCWIKAAPTFDGLRQVLFEPWDRVHIGELPPPLPDNDQIISKLRLGNHNGWFTTDELEFGTSLVAIIGEKGSGKTALADLMALAASAWEEEESSFLTKARANLIGMNVEIEWLSGRTSSVTLSSDMVVNGIPEVRYLSQQFVERLCSSDTLGKELVQEIERVVFEYIPRERRLNSTGFQDLVTKRTESIRTERSEIRDALRDINEKISIGDARAAALPKLQSSREGSSKDIDRIEKQLAVLTSAKSKVALDKIEGLRKERDRLTESAATIRERMFKTKALQNKIERSLAKFTSWYEELRHELRQSGVPEEQWVTFQVAFVGDPSQILLQHYDALQKELDVIVNPPDDSRDMGTLRRVEIDLAKEEKELQLDEARRKQVEKEQKRLQASKAQLRLVDKEIEEIQRWKEEERGRLQNRREGYYDQYFELLAAEKEEMASLYEPLRAELEMRSTDERDLDFEVRTRVDVASWARIGEDMLDLRRSGRYTRRGALMDHANTAIAHGWLNNNVAEIRTGLNEVTKEILDAGELSETLRQGYSPKNVADWLYSVDHITLEYGLKYKGTPLMYLSPGTRGIVLLILYLALDVNDDRPLIVDQPEENLDNASVYSVLTKYLREAKKRRQMIVITHNPNLVVNTDACQVIVASAGRSIAGVPKMGYEYGPLEHVKEMSGSSSIKDRVCAILEGGKSAFKNRSRRYMFLED